MAPGGSDVDEHGGEWDPAAGARKVAQRRERRTMLLVLGSAVVAALVGGARSTPAGRPGRAGRRPAPGRGLAVPRDRGAAGRQLLPAGQAGRWFALAAALCFLADAMLAALTTLPSTVSVPPMRCWPRRAGCVVEPSVGPGPDGGRGVHGGSLAAVAGPTALRNGTPRPPDPCRSAPGLAGPATCTRPVDFASIASPRSRWWSRS